MAKRPIDVDVRKYKVEEAALNLRSFASKVAEDESILDDVRKYLEREQRGGQRILDAFAKTSPPVRATKRRKSKRESTRS